MSIEGTVSALEAACHRHPQYVSGDDSFATLLEAIESATHVLDRMADDKPALVKFSQLGGYLRLKIAKQHFDVDSLAELTGTQLANLELDSPDELFEKYLIWEGIIGYSRTLHEVHEEIFGKASA